MGNLYNLVCFHMFESHLNMILADILEIENYFDLAFLYEEKDKF